MQRESFFIPKNRDECENQTHQTDGPRAQVQEAAQQVQRSEPVHLTQEDLKEDREQKRERSLSAADVYPLSTSSILYSKCSPCLSMPVQYMHLDTLHCDHDHHVLI